MHARKPPQTPHGVTQTIKSFFPGFDVRLVKDTKKNLTSYVIHHEYEAVLAELARQLGDEYGPKIRNDNGQPKTVAATNNGYNLHLTFDDFQKIAAYNDAGHRIMDGYPGFKISAQVLERQWLHQVDDDRQAKRPKH